MHLQGGRTGGPARPLQRVLAERLLLRDAVDVPAAEQDLSSWHRDNAALREELVIGLNGGLVVRVVETGSTTRPLA